MARSEVWHLVSRTKHADCESVRLSGAGQTDAATRTLLLPFDTISAQRPRSTPRVLNRRQWAASVLHVIASAASFGAISIAAKARIDLLPFQLEPALAMLRHGHLRILIADEVGLGKTIQAGLLLSELARRDDGFRAIVVMPAGLREQWRRELRQRFALDSVVADAGWLTAMSRQLPPEVNPWSLPGIHLASGDLVKRPEVLRAIEDVTWDLFVLDEAHAAGVATARLAAAAALGQRSRRVLLLTATPPDGDPAQFAALTAIGALGDEDPLVEFRRTRDDAGFGCGRRTVMLQVRPSSAERRMHRILERYTRLIWMEAGERRDGRARLVAAVLRKRALSSPHSLAASVRRRALLLEASSPAAPESQMRLPLGDEDPLDDAVSDGVLGATGLEDGARELALLGDIEAAARTAAARESKVAFLLRLLRRAKEPLIVFTEYRDTLLHLEHALRAAGFSPLLLHGGMMAKDRTAVQEAFNDRGALLLATDAAAEGLNLHGRCRLVVHFELPWTPARLEQRTGRVDRFGQRRKVHEVLLIARHTAERTVLAPLVRRARAARQRAGTGYGSLAALTESRVAQAVMDGRPLQVEADDSHPKRNTICGTGEAASEVARIAFERRFPSKRSPRIRPVVTSGPPRGAAGRATLLYRAVLQDPCGRIVHSAVIPLETCVNLPATAPLARDLRAQVVRFEPQHHRFVSTAVGRAVATSIELARLRHAGVATSLRARERRLIEQLPSTARRLVQAGLFDRRAFRHDAARRRTARLLIDEAQERSEQIAAAEGLTLCVMLVAARFHPRRAR